MASPSARTIRRRLQDSELKTRRPAKKPLLSRKNVRARLQFARKYGAWTVDQWKNVIFSDESKFNIINSDGKKFVRRPVGKRFDPKYTISTVKHGGGSVMVWGCFSGRGMGPLHQIEGTMDRFMYKDILENLMTPYADEVMPLNHYFQHDNDPKHASKVVKDWLKAEKINVIEWPSQSPDMNPIENLWDYLDRSIRDKKYKNKQELFKALQDAWDSIDMSLINRLIESMPRRLSALVKNRGYATQY